MLYRLISVDTTYCIMTLIIGVDKLLITLRLVKSYPPSAFPHAEFYGGGSFFRLYSLAFVDIVRPKPAVSSSRIGAALRQ